ncbi:MAG: NAD(P)H-dependent oxidoreductase [Actinomycetota bacterium]
MQILTFAASTSRQSINGQLIGYAERILDHLSEGAVTIDHLDLNDFEMPIYSIDRQNEGGIPEAAHEFYRRITAADGLLISFAEHNGLYTAAYKNLFDWTSRIDMRVYQDKPTVMLATSIGARGGANVLKTAVTSAPFFGNDVRAELSIPRFGDNFDTKGGTLTDPDLDTQLRSALAVLLAAAESSDD